MIKTIAGPFSKKQAIETAGVLDDRYSAYGVNINDDDGYIDETLSDLNWYVEIDDSIAPRLICGKAWEEIKAMQQRSV